MQNSLRLLGSISGSDFLPCGRWIYSPSNNKQIHGKSTAMVDAGRIVKNMSINLSAGVGEEVAMGN